MREFSALAPQEPTQQKMVVILSFIQLRNCPRQRNSGILCKQEARNSTRLSLWTNPGVLVIHRPALQPFHLPAWTPASGRTLYLQPRALQPSPGPVSVPWNRPPVISVTVTFQPLLSRLSMKPTKSHNCKKLLLSVHICLVLETYIRWNTYHEKRDFNDDSHPNKHEHFILRILKLFTLKTIKVHSVTGRAIVNFQGCRPSVCKFELHFQSGCENGGGGTVLRVRMFRWNLQLMLATQRCFSSFSHCVVRSHPNFSSFQSKGEGMVNGVGGGGGVSRQTSTKTSN